MKIIFMGIYSLALIHSSIFVNGQVMASDYESLQERALQEIYALKIDLDYLQNNEKKILSNLQIQATEDVVRESLLEVQKKIRETEARLKKLQESNSSLLTQSNLTTPQTLWVPFNEDWRSQKEKLIISDPSHYALKDGEIVRELRLDLRGATDYQLGLVNSAWKPVSKQDRLFDDNASETLRFFEMSMKCDADFKVKKDLFAKKIGKNSIHNFRLYEQGGRSPKITLELSNKINNCEVRFKNPKNPNESYGVRLVSDLKAEDHITELQNRFEACLLPDASHLKGMEKLFLTPNYNSMTCVEEISDIKTLEEPIDGLKAKAETLLGQDLSEKFLAEMNPYAELDFSRAPKLNTVLISYLVFRHDFYGTLIARLAKWHADHGAQVRIIMSEVIANKKDRKMLNELVESSNNIKVQEYKFNSDGGTFGDHFDQLHRTMHVKLLITLSENPKDNVVYIGGRNIHDGFVFMQTPDHSDLPDLVQYGNHKGADEGYAPWRDYEMRIRSKKFAEQTASHYMTLWQKDSQSFYVRSINQNIISKLPANPSYFNRADESALIRHFISIPFKDNGSLEKLYVDIFDHAEKSVRLSTPYFRPTKKIGESMKRAVARGVEVTLITRIDLKGDTADIILGDVNKEGINQFLNKFKIYEYTEPGVILHSKIVLVDDKVSFIGSVNLNKRSFIHDTENVVMIYNPAYNKKMSAIMDGYRIQTREVTTKQKVALWKKIVIGAFDEEF